MESQTVHTRLRVIAKMLFLKCVFGDWEKSRNQVILHLYQNIVCIVVGSFAIYRIVSD